MYARVMLSFLKLSPRLSATGAGRALVGAAETDGLVAVPVGDAGPAEVARGPLATGVPATSVGAVLQLAVSRATAAAAARSARRVLTAPV